MTNGDTTTKMKQKSPYPTTKVISGGLSGAVTVIVVWALNSFNVLPEGTQIPGEIASAITTVVSFVVGYLVPASARDELVPR